MKNGEDKRLTWSLSDLLVGWAAQEAKLVEKFTGQEGKGRPHISAFKDPKALPVFIYLIPESKAHQCPT